MQNNYYKNKYFKYKNKYLNLSKKLSGGASTTTKILISESARSTFMREKYKDNVSNIITILDNYNEKFEIYKKAGSESGSYSYDADDFHKYIEAAKRIISDTDVLIIKDIVEPIQFNNKDKYIALIDNIIRVRNIESSKPVSVVPVSHTSTIHSSDTVTNTTQLTDSQKIQQIKNMLNCN